MIRNRIFFTGLYVFRPTQNPALSLSPRCCQVLSHHHSPCYMAPEMLGEDPSRISERTDVYLLGAILYELVCESPPHDGPNIAAMFASVLNSQPTSRRTCRWRWPT